MKPITPEELAILKKELKREYDIEGEIRNVQRDPVTGTIFFETPLEDAGSSDPVGVRLPSASGDVHTSCPYRLQKRPQG